MCKSRFIYNLICWKNFLKYFVFVFSKRFRYLNRKISDFTELHVNSESMCFLNTPAPSLVRKKKCWSIYLKKKEKFIQPVQYLYTVNEIRH